MASASEGRLPKISVVVPSFNQGEYLGEALSSIFRQEYPYVEIVVMDGGSSDGSLAIIHEYANRLTYWQSQADGGQSAALNAGVAHCTGDLVAWLNSDDCYCDDALWTVGRAWADRPACGLYIGNGFRLDQEAGALTPFCQRHVALNRLALVQGLDYILQPAVFFLRSAWEEVGGVRKSLRFCMDWDIVLRIARTHEAVLVNEFLATSREYGETKTSQGGLGRVVEICDMLREHTPHIPTPGGAFYALEALLGLTAGMNMEDARHHIYAALMATRPRLQEASGNQDGFPEQSDPQDHVYVPAARHGVPARFPASAAVGLPTLSVVTPSFNQAAYLGAAIESVLAQEYPNLEALVFDGGSTDGSVDVLDGLASHLAYWESRPDRGPAHAINKGLVRSSGEVVGWLNSDDVLAPDALWHVAKAFAADPDLDLVYGNALYVDERQELFLADHGCWKTGFYFGDMQPRARIPAYWEYVHAVPQPTVFFRRRLLDRWGLLDESFHFIFDFELFFRFSQGAKIRKLERTLALYRIHSASKTSDWNKFLVELYRFSRPWWPRVFQREFRNTLRGFLRAYARRRCGPRLSSVRSWGMLALVAAMAATGKGNPEALGGPRPL